MIVKWLNTTERSIRSGLTRLENEEALSSDRLDRTHRFDLPIFNVGRFLRAVGHLQQSLSAHRQPADHECG